MANSRQNKSTSSAKKAKTSQRTLVSHPRLKKSASSAATGGAGVTFENRVQAVKLLHMCLGLDSPGIPSGWSICELRFQARVHGPQTDDLVCTIRDTLGAQRRIFLQMKSGLTARKSTKAFQDSIGGAWLDYSNTQVFNKGEDQIVIIHDAEGRHHMSGAVAVVKAAALSLRAEEWLEKVEGRGVSNQLKRNALLAFREIIGKLENRKISDTEIFDFLRHLSFISHDLEDEGTPEYVQLVNSIRENLFTVGYKVDPTHVWSKLVTVCMTCNTHAAGISFSNLNDLIGSDLDRAFRVIREGLAKTLSFGFLSGGAAASISTIGNQANIVFASPQMPTRDTFHEVIPPASARSENKIISNQLDHVNSRIREGKFEDAMSDLIKLGEDMKPFDAHQKARWYLMRGACNWHLDRESDAATDFIKAADICDDDDRLAAARARGWLLKKDLNEASNAATAAQERFPLSLPVWLISKNIELLQGKEIKEDDIPVDYRTDADVLQLVAWSAHRLGNITHAAEIARRAASMPTASYFTRDLALAFTLESIANDSLNVAFYMITRSEQESLSEAVTAFEPNIEKLWKLQSASTLLSTVSNLALAYLLLKRSDRALDLVRDARIRNVDGVGLIRVELEAYCQKNDFESALAAAEHKISSMPVDALVSFSQLAANLGKIALVLQALDAAEELRVDREEVREVLTILLWEAYAKAGKSGEAKEKILSENVLGSNSFLKLVHASQLLRRSGESALADRYLDQAMLLVTNTSAAAERYTLAKTLFYAKRFSQCIHLYESLLRPSTHSELHNDLLYCYLKTNAFAKAKSLLDSLPSDWMKNDEARHMAIELAQEVGDSKLLKCLASEQLAAAPDHAMSWILALMVAGRDSNTHLNSILAQIPESLNGNEKEVVRIASCEMINGFEQNGIKRLYAMRRKNLANVDTAAMYLASHMLVKKPLPNFESTLPRIAQGTFFVIEDEDGRTFSRAIDPQGLDDLPVVGEFRSVDDNEITPFLGAEIGDEIYISPTFGLAKKMKVVAIGSAYKYLIDSSHKVLKESISSSSLLSVIELPEDEKGELDFSQLRDQVIRGSKIGHEILEAYKTAPLTLGRTCSLLSKGVFDGVCEWPGQIVNLDVGGYTDEQRAAAENLFSRSKARYVIDAATLIELGRVDCLDLLAQLPKLYCATRTYYLLRNELEESKRVPHAGTAVAHNGSLAFIEVSAENWASRIKLLMQIIEAIENFCELIPSYGPVDADSLNKIREAVSDEEAAVLAVALEFEATIFCLDARLRLLGGVFCNLEGVWPQAFLSYCASVNVMSQRDYALVCLKFFLSGRNFVSLNSDALLTAIYQGNIWTTSVLKEFNRRISLGMVTFNSAINVVIGLLYSVARSERCQVGFFIELTMFMVDGLARHRDCPENFSVTFFRTLRRGVGIRSLSDQALDYLSLAIHNAVYRSKNRNLIENFRGKILFCSSPPWLLSGIGELENVELLRSPVAVEERLEIPSEEVSSGASGPISKLEDVE